MSLSIGSPGTGSAPRPGSLPGPGRPAKKPSRRTTQVRRNALVMAWLLTAAVLAALTIVGHRTVSVPRTVVPTKPSSMVVVWAR